MAYKITDDCTGCGGCESECPNTAITSGEDIYIIDPDKCTECVGSYDSSRCELACAMSSIVLDPAHEETREQLLGKWKNLHPGETPAVT